MIVIDASVWISFLVRQDVNYAATHTWMTHTLTAKTPIVAPILLLAEIGGALSRRLDKPEIGEKVIAQLLSMPTLRLISIEHELGIQAGHIAAQHQLRGADSIYVAVAKALNVPLVSWDQEHLTRAANLITAYTPVQMSSIE